MIRRFAIAAALASCALGATASNGQPAEGFNVDVAACLTLETREQQLECYEDRDAAALRASEAEASANQAASPPVDDAPSSPVPSTETGPAPERESRRSERRQQQLRPAAVPREAPSEADDEIVARIRSFQEIEPNAYLIYLDNGQVWRQNRPRRYLLRVDAEVRLRSTHWGESYRLTDPNAGGFIQVERVR